MVTYGSFRILESVPIDKKADEDGIIAAVQQLIFTVTSYIKSVPEMYSQ